MCTAEEVTTNFDSVSDYSTVAVFANWRHGLDCALKAVEGVSRACGDDIETLVIIVSTNLASGHKSSFQTAETTKQTKEMPFVVPKLAFIRAAYERDWLHVATRFSCKVTW
jgi:hypothetical protein